MMISTDLPIKTKVYQHEALDSTKWDEIVPRESDIVIATSMKTGTTWMERIISLLVHQDPKRIDAEIMNAPWPDGVIFEDFSEVLKKIERIPYRRFFKCHIPLDGFDYSEKVKYVHVSRDTRDVFMSLANHWSLISDFLVKTKRKHPPLYETQGDIHEIWEKYATKSTFPWEKDGWPYWSNNQYSATFWDYRFLPNILFVHYADLLQDLDGQMQRVSDFLDIEVDTDSELWAEMVDAATFNSMKRDGDKLIPKFQKIFKGGAKSFMFKGKNGRWKEVFNEKDLAIYEQMRSNYDSDMMDWIEQGSIQNGNPQGR